MSLAKSVWRTCKTLWLSGLATFVPKDAAPWSRPTSRAAPQGLAAVPRGAPAAPVVDATAAPAARPSEEMSDISDNELLLAPVPVPARGEEAAPTPKRAQSVREFRSQGEQA